MASPVSRSVETRRNCRVFSLRHPPQTRPGWQHLGRVAAPGGSTWVVGAGCGHWGGVRGIQTFFSRSMTSADARRRTRSRPTRFRTAATGGQPWPLSEMTGSSWCGRQDTSRTATTASSEGSSSYLVNLWQRNSNAQPQRPRTRNSRLSPIWDPANSSSCGKQAPS